MRLLLVLLREERHLLLERNDVHASVKAEGLLDFRREGRVDGRGDGLGVLEVAGLDGLGEEDGLHRFRGEALEGENLLAPLFALERVLGTLEQLHGVGVLHVVVDAEHLDDDLGHVLDGAL